MKAVIQRVGYASVDVDSKTVGKIGNGLLVLLGVHHTDDEKCAELLASKVAKLRIFCDESEKMNLSVTDVSGEILCISNFTLCANTQKGNRPSFTEAMEPEKADELYNLFCNCLLQNGVKNVEKGIFGADMKVGLLNDGPITIVLDTDVWNKK